MMEVKIPTSKIREVLESSGYAYTPDNIAAVRANIPLHTSDLILAALNAYAVEWLVCWHEINPCTFHHFGWRFWHWVPCWAYCEAMEGGDIAEQSYLDSFRKVEYSDNGRVAVITAY